MERKTINTIIINASTEQVYNAFKSRESLESWLVPDGMSGKVHWLDFRVGGGYEMSLFYPDDSDLGKTAEKEDKYSAGFVELRPFSRIVQLNTFHSTDEKFAGKMRMIVDLESMGEKTKVTFTFKNIPIGISLEDNEAGTSSSLEKLKKLLE